MSVAQTPQDSTRKAAPAASKNPKTAQAGAAAAARSKTVLWTVRVEQFAKERGRQVKEILKGLRSPDRPTRRMSALFLASLIGLFLVSGVGIHRYREMQRIRGSAKEEETARNLGEFLKKQAEEARQKASLLDLGVFSIELRASKGQKPIPGVVNMAEVEITLECDSKQTRELVERNQAKVKSAVTNALTAVERAELMSRDGKKRIKKSIIDRINESLPSGKIEEVYFTKLLLS